MVTEHATAHAPAPRSPEQAVRAEKSESPFVRVRTCRPTSSCVLVQVCGELDAAACRYLHEVLAPRLSSMVQTLVLDLSGLNFVAVAGLELLAHLHRLATVRGISLRVVTGPRCLHRALLAGGMSHSLPCYTTRSHALTGVAGRPREDAHSLDETPPTPRP